MYNSWDFYGVEITNPIYGTIWNPSQNYKNMTVTVTCNMKVKENDVQSQDGESTRTKDSNDKSKEILCNARGK